MSRPTLSAIGKAVNLSSKQVGRHIKNGVFPDDGTLGEYALARIRWLEARVSGGSNEGDVDYTEERARLTKEQRIGQELKNAQLRKELAPITMLTAALAKQAAKISAIFHGLPGQMKRKLPQLTATDLDVVDRVVVKCMNTVANLPVVLDELIDDELAGN